MISFQESICNQHGFTLENFLATRESLLLDPDVALLVNHVQNIRNIGLSTTEVGLHQPIVPMTFPSRVEAIILQVPPLPSHVTAALTAEIITETTDDIVRLADRLPQSGDATAEVISWEIDSLRKAAEIRARHRVTLAEFENACLVFREESAVVLAWQDRAQRLSATRIFQINSRSNGS